MRSDRFVTLRIPPTPTPRPTRTPTPIPTSTPLPQLSETQVEAMVYQMIATCKLSIDRAYGAATTVSYRTRYVGEDSWLVDAYWPAKVNYGKWTVDSRLRSVAPFDTSAQTVLDLGSRCGLPANVKPIS